MTISYNPENQIQKDFLAALATGETANAKNCYTLGVGGHDLSHCPRRLDGFPIWDGVANSHAAGRFQFEPRTWAGLHRQYGYDWSKPSDQDAAAWMLAQQDYRARTGDGLMTDLSLHLFSKVQHALAATWPSTNGNGASPHGLASLLIGASHGKW